MTENNEGEWTEGEWIEEAEEIPEKARRKPARRISASSQELAVALLDGTVTPPEEVEGSAVERVLASTPVPGKDRVDHHKAMLQAMMDDLQGLLPKMVKTTSTSSEGSKGAYALATIINTIQSLVSDLGDHDDPDEKYRIIEKEVEQPMMQNFISALATEMENARLKIERVTPPESHRAITDAFRGMVTGASLKCETNYKASMDILRTILGARS